MKEIKGSAIQEIKFPIKDGVYTITVNFKPKVSSMIEKKGVPQGFNTNSVDWTVDVNKSLQTVNNAAVIDPIPAGLELVAGSIKVHHLNVNLNGATTVGDAVYSGDYLVGLTDDGQDFKITFTDESINSAYHITYSTVITDTEADTFTNTATLIGDNIPSKDAAASVTVQRGELLDKKAVNYDRNTQTITWEIKYNYGEKNITQAGAKIKDLFGSNQKLVDNTLEVYPITFRSQP